MTGITIGSPAPSFRLPSAQGPEIGADDYRGRKHVIVWFTKGMGCPFCRSHMSQLARGYPEFQKRDAEILEISISPVARARLYAQKFQLPFPYLCDPDLRVHAQWGLGRRAHGLGYYAVSFVMGAFAAKPANDYGAFAPPLDEMRGVLSDDDMGFFIVDKQGVVRYSLAGSYVEGKGARPIPSNDEVVSELDRL
ncbi:MAG: AhpC/TSA family protein [Deltaproteobacteria bacterium]|nr:AhpC/TSA family protein [Deltaproteobacteria bacterium]